MMKFESLKEAERVVCLRGRHPSGRLITMKRWALLLALWAFLTQLPLVARGATKLHGQASPQQEALKVDLDLSGFNALMAYSGLFNVLAEPDPWVGKVIKLKGRFATQEDPETGARYFGVSVVDETACCGLGIDFVLREQYKYPEDYPEVGADVTVAGKFEVYQEGEEMYCRLTDANLF